MQAEFLNDEERVNSLITVLSQPRLSKYLNESGGDRKKALSLYHWNSQLSQSLYLPLQAWEVVLRNKINNFFIYKYGPKWPRDEKALRNFNRNDERRLEECIRRLDGKSSSGAVSTDQIVAGLSAGFWVSQFGKDYAGHYAWKSNLKFRIFVHDPKIDRETADEVSNDLLDLRNRVAHHEPIFHLPLPDLRDDLDWMLSGMCKATPEYLTSACSFKAVWDSRPE